MRERKRLVRWERRLVDEERREAGERPSVVDEVKRLLTPTIQRRCWGPNSSTEGKTTRRRWHPGSYVWKFGDRDSLRGRWPPHHAQTPIRTSRKRASQTRESVVEASFSLGETAAVRDDAEGLQSLRMFHLRSEHVRYDESGNRIRWILTSWQCVPRSPA